jgi:phage/plasmid-associated DNA primase
MVSLVESEAAVVVAGQFRPWQREDLITKHANVSFDQNARCPNWMKFLRTVTGGPCRGRTQ